MSTQGKHIHAICIFGIRERCSVVVVVVVVVPVVVVVVVVILIVVVVVILTDESVITKSLIEIYKILLFINVNRV